MNSNDRNSFGAPSALTYGLSMPSERLGNLVGIAGAVSLAVVWAVALFTSIQILGTRLIGAYTTWLLFSSRQLNRNASVSGRVWRWWVRGGWVPVAIVTVLSSLMLPWIDPAAGFHAVTLRLLGSSLVAVLVVSLVSQACLAMVVHRRFDLHVTLRTRAWTVVVQAVAIAASRWLYLIPGLLIAPSHSVAVTKRDEYRSAEISNMLIRGSMIIAWAKLAFGVLAWVGFNYVPVDRGPWLLMLRDAMVQAATISMISVMFTMVPMPGTMGWSLMKQSLSQWFALAVLSAGLVVLVVLPVDNPWFGAVGTWNWLSVLSVFVAVIVALLAFDRYRPSSSSGRHTRL